MGLLICVFHSKSDEENPIFASFSIHIAIKIQFMKFHGIKLCYRQQRLCKTKKINERIDMEVNKYAIEMYVTQEFDDS